MFFVVPLHLKNKFYIVLVANLVSSHFFIHNFQQIQIYTSISIEIFTTIFHNYTDLEIFFHSTFWMKFQSI